MKRKKQNKSTAKKFYSEIHEIFNSEKKKGSQQEIID
jgi:hypothetical protein